MEHITALCHCHVTITNNCLLVHHVFLIGVVQIPHVGFFDPTSDQEACMLAAHADAMVSANVILKRYNMQLQESDGE